ncbi:hypothetical protein A1O3_08746 [Capronia epimyces CBS 606.96]|uniref:Protein-tyrosine phosphatase n=1 Tax=Capronia epimyces CBS 606.96 TaxID=1182542 RepID=W9XPH9_9EURO|nr:uncharacterized protein A1O3_08746 [Capronia epimyces CBS 606.96]EXJ79245.1 hypothetical protein A1O3_08746 [Capronia epimyces CBS 606.96]
MPQSLTINTPPSHAIKRQRSQETQADSSTPPSPGQAPSTRSTDEHDNPARQVTTKLPSYLNSTRQEISAAFQDLEWKQRYRLQHAFQNPESSPFRVDRSPAVISRNRYGNVQPWESARVKLKKPVGGSDYVNASPIILSGRNVHASRRSGTPVSASAARIESKYIASQGPKEGQFSHFWHMVMQETTGDVGVIIMLTQLYEGNKEKCAQYYPPNVANPTIALAAPEDGNEKESAETTDDGDPFLDVPAMIADTDGVGTDSYPDKPAPQSNMGDESPAQCGTVRLISLHDESRLGCEVRRLKVTIDGESKEIYHYFYKNWPDFGKPEAEDRRALMELTKVTKSVAGDSPRIVHCSAGVGRTGTWIALDFLLQELEAGVLVESSSYFASPQSSRPSSNGTWGKSGPPKPSTPDSKDEEDAIFETVNALREQRMMMVMNELQYSFLYEALREAFIEKYAQKETGPMVTEVQEPSPKIARKSAPFGGMFEGNHAGQVRRDEDTVSETGIESEAETEIMEKNKREGNTRGDPEPEADTADPYVAVAPETIREGQRKQEQDTVRDHEVQ